VGGANRTRCRGEAKQVAMDNVRWRDLIAASLPTGDEEERVNERVGFRNKI